MSQGVPAVVFDHAAAIAALRKQQWALEAELQTAVDDYLSATRTIPSDDKSDLVAALEGFKLVHGTGWEKLSVAAGLPKLRDVIASQRSQCNDGEGKWKGTFPIPKDAFRPARGSWVVYQLLAGDTVLYIGSTGDLSARLHSHSRTKEFDGWRAALCESERQCRDLEAALIDRHRPPLNRMIATPRVGLG